MAVTLTLPLQYPFLYIRNARDNHSPLPSMLYSQLYSASGSQLEAVSELSASSKLKFMSTEGAEHENDFKSSVPPLMWAYQANFNELTTQIGQVLLAGAKGLTLFQTNHAIFQQLNVAKSPVGMSHDQGISTPS